MKMTVVVAMSALAMAGACEKRVELCYHFPVGGVKVPGTFIVECPVRPKPRPKPAPVPYDRDDPVWERPREPEKPEEVCDGGARACRDGEKPTGTVDDPTAYL